MRRQDIRTPALLVLLPLILAFGCDQPPPMDPVVPTSVKIGNLVSDVDDVASSPGELDRMKGLFAPERVPSKDDLPRYTQFRYQGAEPVQSGDTAIVLIAITDAKTGKDVGKMKWSMAKVNGIWKLTDAPLPPK